MVFVCGSDSFFFDDEPQKIFILKGNKKALQFHYHNIKLRNVSATFPWL